MHLRPLAPAGILALSLLTLAAAPAAFAQELLINGNFDSQAYLANNISFVRAGAPLPGMATVSGSGTFNESNTLIPGWATTVINTNTQLPTIEIWNGNVLQPSQGPGPQSGIQYAEMNSVAAGTLLQPINNLAPGSPLFLSFWHSDRGNDQTASTMRVTLWDLGANGTFDSQLATPANPLAVLGGDDAFLINTLIGPRSYNGSASPITNNWGIYQFQTSSTTTNNMVLTFQSVTSGTFGNFLDTVSLNTTAVAPEPGTLAFLLLGGLSVSGIARRRKLRSNDTPVHKG